MSFLLDTARHISSYVDKYFLQHILEYLPILHDERHALKPSFERGVPSSTFGRASRTVMSFNEIPSKRMMSAQAPSSMTPSLADKGCSSPSMLPITLSRSGGKKFRIPLDKQTNFN